MTLYPFGADEWEGIEILDADDWNEMHPPKENRG
ncbi:MAG: hypothetical protein QOJ65_1135 [Fimbriimonadaceae bacterium]|jgi:hypothetical protein|nr:hypothetical protein [Fimbriimonadaceae bacterium]